MIIPNWLLLTLAVLGLISTGIWTSRFPNWWWPSPDAKDIEIKLLTKHIEQLEKDLISQREDYENKLQKEEERVEEEIKTSDSLRAELRSFQEKLLTKLMN